MSARSRAVPVKKRPRGLPRDAELPEAIIHTDVPGIVLWRYRRRTVTIKGEKRRVRTYSITHEPSSISLLSSGNGGAKHAISLAQALDAVAKLGDVRWKGKPIDWTQDIEALRSNDRVRMATWYVGGWKVLTGGFDKATREWAARNNIELELK